MKTAELLGNFIKEGLQKIAISDELKTNALVERQARVLSDYNSPTNFYKGDLFKMHSNQPNISPEFKQKTLASPTIQNRIKDRSIELFENLLDTNPKTTLTTHANPKYSLSGFLKNKTLSKVLTKHASLAVPSLENLGLGILAVPSVAHLAGKEMGEDAKSKAEVAGLGVLAAHPTYELAQAAKSGIQKQIPNMLDSTSPAIRQVGQGIQSMGSRASSLLGKIRPIMKLGHSAFYRNILKED